MSDNLVYEPRRIYYSEETGYVAFPYSYSGLLRPNLIRRKSVTVSWEHPQGRGLVPKSYYTPVGSYYQEADGQWAGVIGPLQPDHMYIDLGPFDTEDEARLHFITVFELEEMDKALKEIPFN